MDEDKKEDKIKEIDEYLTNLESYIPSNFGEYIGNSKTKDACERCFEKIIEAVVDLAFIIINEKKLRIPKEDTGAFDVLFDKGIISSRLCKNLKSAKGMRNIIAHEYGKIDDALVFEAVTEQLIPDVKEFISFIEKGK